MKLFGKRKRRDDEDRFNDPLDGADLQLLKHMTDNGVDLGVPRLVEHFLFLPLQAATEDAASLLRPSGFDTEVREAEPPAVSTWVVGAKHTIVLTPQEIRRLRQEFTRICIDRDGEYDGWDVSVGNE